MKQKVGGFLLISVVLISFSNYFARRKIGKQGARKVCKWAGRQEEMYESRKPRRKEKVWYFKVRNFAMSIFQSFYKT